MRVAVVGSGVSGLAATWLLNEHSEHEVNLYESADYVGGHVNTVAFKKDGQEDVDVDTGFIVFNPPTYPNFLNFLHHKSVLTQETNMTFSVTRDRGLFEWAGEGLGGIFCQKRNIFNPRVYRMIWDVLRFNLFGLDLIEAGGEGTRRSKEGDMGEAREESIGEFMERNGYGEGFKEDYLLAMTAAIWSTPADKCALDFPAKTLIRFFHNHHLMQITGKPKWLTIKGGSKSYVKTIVEKLPPYNVHLNSPIASVTPHSKGVTLTQTDGQVHEYDHVILATHSDTALKMLDNGTGATEEEREILGAFEWSENEAILHWDERMMPIRRRAWSAWNVLTSSENPSDSPSTAASEVNTVSLTYDMNILQKVPESKYGPVLVTLNPPFPVDESKVVGRYQYQHPMYSKASVEAQLRLRNIQNTRNLTYAGAWTNYGFHEDGFTSGLKVAHDLLGADCPFTIRPPDRRIVRQEVARTIVSSLEIVRRVVVQSGAWGVVVWVVMMLCGLGEWACGVLGWKGWKEEVGAVKGFWRPGGSGAKRSVVAGLEKR